MRILTVHWKSVLTPCFINFSEIEKQKWEKIFEIWEQLQYLLYVDPRAMH